MMKIFIKKYKKRILQLFVFFSLLNYCYAVKAGAPYLLNKTGLRVSACFVENKGQLTDQYGNLRTDVKYVYAAQGFRLALKGNSFSYELYTISKNSNNSLDQDETNNNKNSRKFKNLKLNSHRLDISFIGANTHPQIIAAQKQTSKEIFYLPSGKNGIEANSFKQLTYKNIYNNIDLVFYAKEEGQLKYDIIVHPGGRISDIKMKYEGANEIRAQAGNIIFRTSAGNAEESIPYAYVKESKEVINVDYKLNGNIVSFNSNIANINNNKTLVIDPVLKWATYYGGSSYEYCQSTAVDKSGNVYLAGFTESTAYIASTGAYQTSKNLSSDAFLVKFSNSGTRLWATYYGAGDYEEGRYVAVDGNGNVFLSGYTYSTSGLATTSAYQTSNAGNEDCFLVKFNGSGIRKWATYYGGTSWEYAGGLFADRYGNIYIGGETGSSSGIATTGAHQTSLSGGSDAFLVKFDSTGSRQWGTYYGGVNTDAGYSVAIDDSGYVYLGGKTNSSASIATTAGHQTTLGGGSDAFLVKFSNTGIRKWGTYYGGSSADYGYAVAADMSGNIYLAGESSSSSSIATSAGFQSTKGSGSDGFLVKFNRAGSRQWGTYYGGSSAENINGISIDVSENVMVGGSTQSTSGIATTGAHQTTYGGGIYDAFAAKIDRSGKRQWGTYFGGSGDDFGNAVAVDGSSQVFLAGNTGSASGIASTGAYQTTYQGNTDAFLSVFKDLCTIKAVLNAGKDTSFCAGRIEYYTSNKTTGINYSWSVKGGTILYGQNKDSVVVRWDSAGRNFVQVIISPLASCQDSAIHYITVIGLPKVITGGNQTVCNGNVTLGGNPVNGNTYSWKDISSGKIISTSSGFNTSLTPGSYNFTLEVTNSSGCKNIDTAKITVLQKPSPSLSGDTIVCRYTSGHVYTTSNITGNSYVWTVKGGAIISGQNTNSISVNWQNSGTGTVSVKVTNSNNCDSIVSFNNIKINAKPAPKITGNNSVCANTTDNTYSTTLVSGNSYTWSVTGGTISSGQGTNQVKVSWGQTGTGWITVKETNSVGCDTTVELSNIVINTRPSTFITGLAKVCIGQSGYSAKLVSGNKYEWNVKGGSIISGAGTNAITVSWAKAGSGNISVTETNSNGCKDSSTLNIFVYDLPNANTGNDTSICYGENIMIGSAAMAGNSYSWTSSPAGFLSSQANPFVQPLVTTKYYLIETNDSTGCSHKDSILITVNEKPKPEIKGNNNICSGLMTNYVAKKNAGHTYRWKINGNEIQTSSPDSINVGWNTAGINYVTLIESNSTGCEDSVRLDITVFEKPVADISGDTAICINSITSYKTTSKNNSYKWTVTGGSLISNNNDSITIQWDKEGKGFVKLIESNNSQCVDSTVLEINVYKQAVASFTASDICIGETANFLNTGNGADSYFWSFGDGGTSTQENPSHNFAKTGIYTVKLMALSNGGCADSFSAQIQVLALPVSKFSFNITNNYEVNFTPQDTTSGSYAWEFGDGATSGIKMPQHTYAGSGNYPVKLTVTGANGCNSEFTDTVKIGTSGVQENKANDKKQGLITLYPNPFTSSAVLKYELNSTAKVNINITDITGKNIITLIDANQQEGKYVLPINGSALASGVYLVKIQTGNSLLVKQLIKL